MRHPRNDRGRTGERGGDCRHRHYDGSGPRSSLSRGWWDHVCTGGVDHEPRRTRAVAGQRERGLAGPPGRLGPKPRGGQGGGRECGLRHLLSALAVGRWRFRRGRSGRAERGRSLSRARSRRMAGGIRRSDQSTQVRLFTWAVATVGSMESSGTGGARSYVNSAASRITRWATWEATPENSRFGASLVC